MLFRKKYERGLQIMHEKNRQYLEENAPQDTPKPDPDEMAEADEKLQAFREEEKLELEKGDLPAMILSAMLVFGPIILVLCGLLTVFWFLLH
ncbi:MAG: hypothetical protein IJJ43_01735 [Oscillospiraceae bacterium]|nr:hypothetical protein [Oscillospiraceae bacterium]